MTIRCKKYLSELKCVNIAYSVLGPMYLLYLTQHDLKVKKNSNAMTQKIVTVTFAEKICKTFKI